MKQTVLVTGGMGYIGSHTIVQLLQAGHEVICLDNLSNSKISVMNRIEQISGRQFRFVHGDIRNVEDIERALSIGEVDSVIHFAGLKAVGESIDNPLDYYDNNVSGTNTLLSVLESAGVFRFVFSSSATVYGNVTDVPIKESAPTHAINPYGRTKLMVEQMLSDLTVSDARWSVSLLRYFNPVGAHPTGLIGEDPKGTPNNLVPYIAQVAVGRRSHLSVFGDDYDTIDGTGVRDYIHVMDLADGHLAALDVHYNEPGCYIYNLGTGIGYTVLDMIHAFEKASGRDIPYQVTSRRPGDIATCFADSSRAQTVLGWRPTRKLEDMMVDTWRWQSLNPLGLP